MNVNIDYMVRHLSITEQDTPKINPLSSVKRANLNGSTACPERSRRVEPFTSLAGEAGFGLSKPKKPAIRRGLTYNFTPTPNILLF